MTPPADSFSLEPSTARGGRPKLYAQALPHYVPIYSTELRQIKNWLKLGRGLTPPELPPLDQPQAMMAWWAKAYPNRSVPEKIHQAATKAKHEALGVGAVVTPKNSTKQTSEQKTPGGETTTPPTPPEPTRTKIDNFDAVDEMDLPAAVARQKRILAVTMKRLEEAMSSDVANDSLEALLSRRVAVCMESLRKLEGTLDELRKSREELIDRATAGEELRRIHTAMSSSTESRIVDELGVDRTRARAFVDSLFALFRTSRFFSDTVPALSPIAA